MKTLCGTWGSMLLVFSFLAGPALAGNILLVVGNSTSPLGAGDARIKTLLESKGHTVTAKTDANAVTGDATGKHLVVITASVWSSTVNTKFRDVAVPVLNWEQNIIDDMGMANGVVGEHGTTDMYQVSIVLASHQMAAGFTGTVTVYTSSTLRGTYAKPNANAVKVATTVADPTRATIFGYETGAGMFGLNAPARRVGFFLDEDASVGAMNDDGVTLFHAACNWAMSITEPIITTHPADTMVNPGQTASFSVSATGGALKYQWRKNGVNISGATSSSYTTPATVAADNGALFSVVVTNSAGSATSTNAVLTLAAKPLIVTEPKDRIVVESQAATFSVEAAGTAPLAYQWRRNAANISGATSSSYTLPAASLGDNGAVFSCVVSNSAGSDTSASAKLSVVALPHVSETQYYTEPNSNDPAFKLGWNDDGQYAFFEHAGIEQLRLKDDVLLVPSKLYFGLEGGMGFQWTQADGHDILTLVSGIGSGYTDVLQVRHGGMGLDGLYFPEGFSFPFRGDTVASTTKAFSGEATDEGVTFFRDTRALETLTEEISGFNVDNVNLRKKFTSSEVDHGYVEEKALVLDAGQLIFTDTSSSTDTASETLVDAWQVVTGTLRAGTVVTSKWRVKEVPDYVFEDSYPLKPLEEVEAFTKRNKHLPHMPSAKKLVEHGVDLTEMNMQLLKTVEELTLHMMALNKEIKSQKSEMRMLKERLGDTSGGKAAGK